MLHVME